MNTNTFIVLTGGPGGGKSRLIEELRCDQAWSGRIADVPDAISSMCDLDVKGKGGDNHGTFRTA